MTNRGDKDKHKVIHLQNKPEEQLPDFYVNQVNMAFSVYDVTFTFGTMPMPEEVDTPPNPVVKVRMSPQHAKVFSMLLKKNLDQYESDIGQIQLPEKLLKDLQIEK